jgi:molybdopterin-guanine dinucleotide biosynthesis protein A
MTDERQRVSVVIQAGGRGRRMSDPKPLIQLAGRPLIEHVLERVGKLGDEVLITTNQPESLDYLGVRLVADPEGAAGAGALTGLATALHAASRGLALVVGCDMPFVSPSLAVHLIRLAQDQPAGTIVVPRGAKGLEPLLAV